MVELESKCRKLFCLQSLNILSQSTGRLSGKGVTVCSAVLLLSVQFNGPFFCIDSCTPSVHFLFILLRLIAVSGSLAATDTGSG